LLFRSDNASSRLYSITNILKTISCAKVNYAAVRVPFTSTCSALPRRACCNRSGLAKYRAVPSRPYYYEVRTLDHVKCLSVARGRSRSLGQACWRSTASHRFFGHMRLRRRPHDHNTRSGPDANTSESEQCRQTQRPNGQGPITTSRGRRVVSPRPQGRNAVSIVVKSRWVNGVWSPPPPPLHPGGTNRPNLTPRPPFFKTTSTTVVMALPVSVDRVDRVVVVPFSGGCFCHQLSFVFPKNSL